jgi:predicted PurR-regulated permease PerM
MSQMSNDSGPVRGVAHSRFYARTFALAATGLLGYLLYRIAQPLLVQIAWAALLAALLYPVHRWLTHKLKDRPSVSSGFISVGGAVALLVPFGLIATLFTRQAAQMLQRMEVAAEQRHIEGLSDLLALPVVTGLLDKLQEFVGVDPNQMVQWASNGAKNALEFLLQSSGNVFVGALGAVGNFLFIIFLLFFFLRDGARAVDILARLIPMPPDRRHQLFLNLSNVARAVVLGTLLVAVLQGTLVGVGFAIAGVPSAIVFGVLAMFASPIPFVGTALVWAPAAVVLFVQGHTGWGIFMVLWGVLVVSMVDNIVRPLVISGKTGVPTLFVFGGLLGGLAAFGSVGMFVGPLLLTLLVALIRYADELVREGERPAVTPLPTVEPSPAPVAAKESPAPVPPTAANQI